jgi:hypothetical protein
VAELFARGIAFEENVYGSATFNVMTRVNVGWQDDNYNLASPGLGTVVDHKQIHTYHRGIFHNLQYQSATAATITNNQIFAETTGDFPASSSNFGLELSSIQSAVGVTVTATLHRECLRHPVMEPADHQHDTVSGAPYREPVRGPGHFD